MTSDIVFVKFVISRQSALTNLKKELENTIVS